jgi:hypothetical protein
MELLMKTKKSKLKTIGIEMPFGYCLVKGSELRKIQTELREAKFKAAVRARLISKLYLELAKKGIQWYRK